MQGQAPATVVSSSKKLPCVRVTLRDDSKLEVYQAAVEGDSLVGMTTDPTSGAGSWNAPTRTTTDPREKNRVAVALVDIQAIEIHAIDGGKTAVMLIGLAALVVVVALTLGSSPILPWSRQ